MALQWLNERFHWTKTTVTLRRLAALEITRMPPARYEGLDSRKIKRGSRIIGDFGDGSKGPEGLSVIVVMDLKMRRAFRKFMLVDREYATHAEFVTLYGQRSDTFSSSRRFSISLKIFLADFSSVMDSDYLTLFQYTGNINNLIKLIELKRRNVIFIKSL